MTLESGSLFPARSDTLQDPTSFPRWISNSFRLLAVVLAAGGVGAAILSESMNADGINYLDMGDAYLRGDWGTAINGVWSPLYSWILGIVLRVAKPGLAWEFAAVHLVNFAIFVLTLVCFEYFWRQVTRECYAQSKARPDSIVLPAWAWAGVGYGLFIWSSLSLVEIYAVTPDMIVAALVYLAAGLLLRSRRPDAGPATLALLGAVLGLGYLAKAALFPLGFVFLAATVVAQPDLRRRPLRVLPALGSFLVVAGVFVAILSVSKGRFTFSDVGALTYLKHVHEVPFPYWQAGVVEGLGEPFHPARVLMDSPRIYEFATPVGGTYPMSYDPYYWFEGLSVKLDVGRQLKAVLVNGRFYFELFFRTQGIFLGVALTLVLLTMRSAGFGLSRPGLALLAISLAALGMYSLVHVTERYIGPFVVLLWMGILPAVRLPDRPAYRRISTSAGGMLVFAVLLNVAAFNLDGLNALTGWLPRSGGAVSGSPAPAAKPSAVAEALLDLGLSRGDSVGVIGYSFDAYWARLARLKIVAEMPPEAAPAFWQAGEATRDEAIGRFASLGVAAVVAEDVPEGRAPPGWVTLGHGRYYALVLREARQADAR